MTGEAAGTVVAAATEIVALEAPGTRTTTGEMAGGEMTTTTTKETAGGPGEATGELAQTVPVPPPAVSSSNSGNLPTRPHPNNSSQNQRKNMSFNVGRSSGSPSSARDADTPMREESRGRDRPEDDDEPEEDEDPDVAAMKAMMGFGGFDTTKNKKVSGNDVGGLRKEKKSEYRQYMNRQGGFNRPLSPSR
ncbi:hypothetical protein V2G26_003179 [Clonostachys chloroleuca]